MGNLYHNDRGWIFTNEFGKHWEPRWVEKQLERLMKLLGIKDVSMHGLHHTAATRAKEAGIDGKARTSQIGYTDVNFTDRS